MDVRIAPQLGSHRRTLGLSAGALMVALYAALAMGAAGDTTADLVLGQGDFTHNAINMIDAQSLNKPSDVAVDTAATPNHVYVIDEFNSRVLGWNNAASYGNGAPADLVIGQPDFLSNTCDAPGITAGDLCFPQGAAVDGSGNLYVTDYGNGRVLEYNHPFAACAGVFPCVGGPANLVFGTGGSFTIGGCNSVGLGADSLCYPIGVALDGSDNLYVADFENSRVLEYDNPLAAGGGTPGTPGAPGDTTADTVFGQGGSFTSTSCNYDTSGGHPTAIDLCFPTGVALDGSDNLYVADQYNQRVLEFNTPLSTDTTADTVFGQGGSFTSNIVNNGGVSADSLSYPSGAAVDVSGNLYVADEGNQRVLEYNTPLIDGTTATMVLGQGGNFASNSCNFDTAGGYPTASDLCGPYGLALDGSGNLYVADDFNSRILKYDSPLSTDDVADRVLGQGDFNHNLANLVHAEGLDAPQAAAIDATASPTHLYVADTMNNRVLGWNDVTTFTNGAKADLVIGQADFLSYDCNYTGVTAGSLCNPTGVAVDGMGNLYVADYYNNRVLEYSNPFTACGGIFPCVGAAASEVFGQGGDATSNACNFDTFGGNSSAIDLCSPQGVALDSSGNLYVADSLNSRVLEYNTPLTNTTADEVFGQNNDFTSYLCNSDTGGTTSTAIDLCIPTGAVVDSMGNLYVADADNNRVLEYNAPLSNTTANEVFGQGGDFTENLCNAITADSLCNPDSLAIDDLDNLYVTDANNNRVLEYNTPLTNTTANEVFGQGGDFTTNGCNYDTGSPSLSSANDLCSPEGVALDLSNNVYVADYSNNRIVIFDQPLATATSTTTITATATPTPTATSTPAGTATTTITVGPASCGSGSVVEGNTSTTCVYTLSNTGFTNHAIVGSITVDDTTDFGVFFTDCQAPGGIPAQSGCSINVSFTPQTTGSFTTHMHVFDNATSSPQTVTVTGTGSLPPPTTDTITPNPLPFGGSPVTVANEQFLTVNNTGFTNPLVLQTLTLTDTTAGYTGANEFSLVPADSSCPIEPAGLGPGSSCIIAIDLTPDVSHIDASITGTLVVTGNATTSPQTINLTGYGVSGITGDGDCYTAPDGSCDATQGNPGFSGQSCLIDAGTCTTVAGPGCNCQ